MHPTTLPSTQATKRGFAAWTTRDLLVTLAINIAIGIVCIPLNNVYTAVNAVNPVAGWAMGGLFALVAGIVFRGLLIAPELAIPAALLGIVSYIVAALIAPRLADVVACAGVLSSTAPRRKRLQEV